MTLEKNTLLNNRYRIMEILGQGGMGSVYCAMDENLKAAVAIKENLFTTEEYTRQFHLEAVILANLRHPNLPRVYDHFTLGDEGQYLVMDFIEGEDLRFRMERTGTISEDDAVQIGAAICDALAYLHSRQPPILHRDIKPGNVKITPDGHIFLVDFGLAKVYQSETQATTTGARAMTPGYSPPEQYGTARTDSRTDIYSLGATLYAAVTGVIPEDALARAMENTQLTPLRSRNSKISRRFAAAIEKAMAVDPSDRFQAAEEFKKALLSAASKTQRVPGEYAVSPPPAESTSPGDSGMSLPLPTPSKSPASPVLAGPVPSARVEEKPFVSPFKKQKERERKRRAALFRFVIVLLVALVIGIPFLMPNILPMEVRNLIPFIAPTYTATSTPSATPSPLPTATLTATATLTQTMTPIPPTETPTLVPTATLPSSGPALVPTAISTVTVTSSPVSALSTPVGGTGQIAYASNRVNKIPQIFIADIASQTALQVTDMPEGACQPAWSPDGAQLVFISPCQGMDDTYPKASLYIINPDGTGLTPIATVPGGDFDPKWSPDGKSIAFTSLRTGQMEIFVLNLADQSVAQLTRGATDVESRQAAWSPNGEKIAYAVKRFGVYQLWLMAADGTGQKQIIRSGSQYSDYLPTWSPDGGLIIFNQRCATKFCLPYLLSTPAEGGPEQGSNLGINVLPIEDVSYSSDGFWFVFEGEGAGQNKDIFYMTVTGANRTQVTTDKAMDFDPVWRPLVTQ
jgi:serine/threonine protein kinase/Tol biopolymer transport system component